MALIIKGKNKGKEVKLHQWCNDWFSVELEDRALIVSPTMLELTPLEMLKVVRDEGKGIMFQLFLPEGLRFKRRRR